MEYNFYLEQKYLKDEGRVEARIPTADQAEAMGIFLFMRSEFSMIEGEEEFIPYPSVRRKPAKRTRGPKR